MCSYKNKLTSWTMEWKINTLHQWDRDLKSKFSIEDTGFHKWFRNFLSIVLPGIDIDFLEKSFRSPSCLAYTSPVFLSWWKIFCVCFLAKTYNYYLLTSYSILIDSIINQLFYEEGLTLFCKSKHQR
jgi:hypothetical protein